MFYFIIIIIIIFCLCVFCFLCFFAGKREYNNKSFLLLDDVKFDAFWSKITIMNMSMLAIDKSIDK